MSEKNTPESRSEKAMQEKAEAHLKDLFQKMPYELSLMLFTDPEKNEPFNEAARQVIRAIRQVASDVSLQEYGLDHELAKLWRCGRRIQTDRHSGCQGFRGGIIHLRRSHESLLETETMI